MDEPEYGTASVYDGAYALDEQTASALDGIATCSVNALFRVLLHSRDQ